MADEPNSAEHEAEYRAFIAAGELRMQCCADCRTFRHPPRFICADCMGETWTWEPMSGSGSVETFLWYFEPVDRRAPEVPYNVALVRLAEGPRLYANIDDVSFGELVVGQRLQATFSRQDDKPVLRFRPARSVSS